MRFYRQKTMSTESICVNKITKGINSIKNGVRSGGLVGKELEYSFNKLEILNKGLYNDLYIQYCTARLNSVKHKKQVKEVKNMHS
jgi:hypothetical protein